ncbi:MAG: hypothetical protein ABL971_10130 [Vicinamibacterales bacterium]
MEGRTRASSKTGEALDAQILKTLLRLAQVGEAFFYDRRVDRATYQRQRDKLREELTLAEIARQEAKANKFDVEGVMGFAEHLIEHAGRPWSEGTLRQRQAVQQAVFPEGLPFNGENLGTGVTCLAFMQLPLSGAVESGTASHTGFRHG